jgi:hypothetical protein
MAARMLGVKEVPAIRLKHLNEVQRRALIIADNKIAENAGWNDELLRQELQALDGEEFDLGLLGFNDEELEAFLNGEADGEGLTDENAAPEIPEKPVSVLGDPKVITQSNIPIQMQVVSVDDGGKYKAVKDNVFTTDK